MKTNKIQLTQIKKKLYNKKFKELNRVREGFNFNNNNSETQLKLELFCYNQALNDFLKELL